MGPGGRAIVAVTTRDRQPASVSRPSVGQLAHTCSCAKREQCSGPVNREATKKCAHRGLASGVVAQPVSALGSAPNCTQRSVSANASKWSEAASLYEGEEEGAHRGSRCELSWRAGEQPLSLKVMAQAAARCKSASPAIAPLFSADSPPPEKI